MTTSGVRVHAGGSCCLAFVFLLFPTQAFADCDEPVGHLFSIQGLVSIASKIATLGVEEVCAGDVIEVGQDARIGLRLNASQTVIRLNRGSRLAVQPPGQTRSWTLQLFDGVMYLFSRKPEEMQVETPFVRAAIEGTEFVIDAGAREAPVTVIEGSVRILPTSTQLSSRPGETIEPSAPTDILRSRNNFFPTGAVEWALFFPQVAVGDARRDAADQLSRGNVKAAESLLQGAADADSLALRSVIATARNDVEAAVDLGRRAVASSPDSSAAHLALSYALQSAFDLEGALDSARRAAEANPDNVYAQIRVAELASSTGYFREALASADRAVSMSEAPPRPGLARAYTIRGFVHLTRMETDRALAEFGKASKTVQKSRGTIQIDPLLPLGIGLALMRQNRVEEGRARIEEAVSLDPNNALLRSYLGKAYYEEKRDDLAAETFDIAKTSDRRDPTPWSYDAALDQNRNRPLDALSNVNESIRLNDNRLAFRSRLQLDQDLAARSTNLARTYQDLGFDRLGYLEGWRALDNDPGSFSARRFLADIFSMLPRHEIARQSELLQSQLRQPLVIQPVQPQIGESGSFIQPGLGTRDVAFNEYTPLFVRERPVAQLNGIVGENGTWGDEILVSGIDGKGSYSIGQFHYETDGTRANADQAQDTLVAFGQWAATPGTNLQFEARSTEIERGDLVMRIDPGNFDPIVREDLNEEIVRFGIRHEFDPGSDLIGSWWHQDFDTTLEFGGGSEAAAELEGDQVEFQRLDRFEHSTLQTGVTYFSGDRTDSDVFMGMKNVSTESETDYGAYGYFNMNPNDDLSITLGLSAQSTEGGLKDADQVNPKFGLAYRLANHGETTIRIAGFRTLQRTIASDQTLEPTTIAGFNQFFDDAEGTEATRYGLGLDHASTTERWFGGFEISRRDLTVTGQVLSPMGPLVSEGDLEEFLGYAYLYWIPRRQGDRWSWTFKGELSREEFERPDGFTGPEEILDLVTETATLGANFFHDSGLGVRVAASHVDQEGTFGVGPPFGAYTDDGDQFWVVDFELNYRLPGRRGLFTIGVNNLLDEKYRYQDTDIEKPRFVSGRYLFGRLALIF